MQKFGKFLLANNLRTSIIALLCILLPFPGNALAAILVGLVCLQRGLLAGLGVLAWVLLPAIAATWKAHSLAMSYDTAFLVCLFVWVFTVFLHWRKNWAQLLELVALFGIILIAFTMLIPHEILMHWMSGLEKIAVDNIKQVVDVDRAALHQVLEQHVYYLIGSLYAVPAIVATIYLMLARSWQLVIMNPEQPRIEFRVIKMRKLVSVLFLLLIAIAMIWHVNWLASMVVIATIPFVFAGFSLVLSVSSVQGPNKLLRIGLLIVALAILLFVAQVALLLLAIAGFVDSWLNFRKIKLIQSGANS